MERIFCFTDMKSIYNRCIMAAVSHGIMVGEYDMLSAEHSWDGLNYLFQDMAGTMGVISFSDDRFVCLIRNDEKYIAGGQDITDKLLKGADEEIRTLAGNEAMQYLLTDEAETVQPSASMAGVVLYGRSSLRRS